MLERLEYDAAFATFLRFPVRPVHEMPRHRDSIVDRHYRCDRNVACRSANGDRHSVSLGRTEVAVATFPGQVERRHPVITPPGHGSRAPPVRSGQRAHARGPVSGRGRRCAPGRPELTSPGPRRKPACPSTQTRIHNDPGYMSRKIRKIRTDKFDSCNKRKFWLT